MDRKLVDKYFRDQCTEEELEQVLNWFQTEKGQAFLQEDIEQLDERLTQNSEMFLYPEVESEKIFRRIQQNKQQSFRRSRWFIVRVASILLVVAAMSTLLYWSGITSPKEKNPQPVFISYVTDSDQQNIFTLSDGTMIRLNEESTLTVPAELQDGKRTVTLEGEAYFEVAKDPDHPFVVHTQGSTVEVLGTKFNVKVDSAANNVQVAVLEGKVALKSGIGENAARALLTQNNFGMLRLSDSQITIEKINTENFISWVNKRLVFSGETLQQVSRQLERLYDIEIAFKSDKLKHLELTADIEKIDLDEVLTTISNTFDINYKMNGNKILWMD